MNKRRIKAAADLMMRVHEKGGQVDITSWQEKDDDDLAVKTEATAYKCGTVCCVAGWIALSPTFKRAGGTVDETSGCPLFGGMFGEGYGTKAIANYFDVDFSTASAICGLKPVGEGFSSDFYGVDHIGQVTPEIVAERLLKLVETGA